MRTTHTREELEREVVVKAELVSQWDGKEVDLRAGKTILNGLLVHFQDAFPDVTFEVIDVPVKERTAKDIPNPLEENDRGEAFPGLKRRTKKEGE